MMGTGQINQRAAQAAAWYLNNNMSWQELTAKRIKHIDGTGEPYFKPQEIQNGMQLAQMAVKVAEEKQYQQQNSGVNSSSSSQNSPGEK
jgi:hypothetical protein